jgi:hypothetical protein
MSSATAETHVTHAGQREDVAWGDRCYVLRPITFGEAAEIAQRQAGQFLGGPALLAETIRRAIEARGGPDMQRHLDALEAHEDADAQMVVLHATRPHPEEPPAAWVDHRRQLQAAQLAVLRAARARQVAERAVADDASVCAARAEQEAAQWGRVVDLVQACLVEIREGETIAWARGPGDAPVFAAAINALPEALVKELANRADALRRPGVQAGKA